MCPSVGHRPNHQSVAGLPRGCRGRPRPDENCHSGHAAFRSIAGFVTGKRSALLSAPYRRPRSVDVARNRTVAAARRHSVPHEMNVSRHAASSRRVANVSHRVVTSGRTSQLPLDANLFFTIVPKKVPRLCSLAPWTWIRRGPLNAYLFTTIKKLM